MPPEDVAALFVSIIDDDPDTDLVYSLMDQAYTRRNEMRNWRMLLKLDTSITHSPGNTYATVKTLPTDFSRPYRVFGGAQDNEYQPVPFEEILMFMNAQSRYTIDVASNAMRLMGAPSAALTIYLWYLYAPTSLTGLTDAQKAATTTIVWPARFASLLAYDMAELFFGGIDADDTTRQMSPMHKVAAKRLEDAMIQWDASIQSRLRDRSSSPRQSGSGDRADVIDLDMSR